MKHPLIRLLVVTGGPGVVQAAMNSGKRAICAGPGNPPAVVDATADIEKAGRDIVLGHSFDNNVICVDEKEVIVVDAVAEALKVAMKRAGAVELRPATSAAPGERAIFEKNAGPRGHAVVNRKLVGKDASVILKELGIPAGPEVRCVLVEVPNDHPLVWTEQMMPVLPLTRVRRRRRGHRPRDRGRGRLFPHGDDALARPGRRSRRWRASATASIFVKNGRAVGGARRRTARATPRSPSPRPRARGSTSPRHVLALAALHAWSTTSASCDAGAWSPLPALRRAPIASRTYAPARRVPPSRCCKSRICRAASRRSMRS